MGDEWKHTPVQVRILVRSGSQDQEYQTTCGHCGESWPCMAQCLKHHHETMVAQLSQLADRMAAYKQIVTSGEIRAILNLWTVAT